jgi:glycosyltransferase involved in cell wall biosynthesis
MRLVFIIDNGKIIGGGEYSIFKIAQYLAKRGHVITVFAANKSQFMDSLENTDNFKINIRHEIPRLAKGVGLVNEIWDRVHLELSVIPYIKNNKPDYIIGFHRKSAIKAVKLGKRCNIRTANFVFESPEWMQRALKGRFENEYKGRFKKSWEKAKAAYLETDRLIPISKLTQKELSAWLGRRIENPVYPGIEKRSVSSIKEQNQIIYIGRLNEYKNVDIIIKALSIIKERPRLVIIGTGEKEGYLKSLAKSLEVDCVFMGSLEDSNKWEEINKSMFMVFPSSFEGFGMPPAEALSYGKPCICTDIPIFREVYGDNVEYFKENDVDTLAEKIRYLASQPKYRKKRGTAGRKFVSRYTWENAAQVTEDLLK